MLNIRDNVYKANDSVNKSADVLSAHANKQVKV
jgi:hypothetical protein